MDGLYASGDNSRGQFWGNVTETSGKFLLCDGIPCRSERITHIAVWDEKTVLVENGSKVLIKDGETVKTYLVGLIKSVCGAGPKLLALLVDGRIVDVVTREFLEGSGYQSLSASSEIVCALNSAGKVAIWRRGSSGVTEELATAAGCTDSAVYACSSGKLWKIDDSGIVGAQFSETIVSIACAGDVAIFLSEHGTVYVDDGRIGDPHRVFGLPPAVSVAAGRQHFAAVTFDGRLFTWGFNPSGQLGTGDDFPRDQPVMVMSGVCAVACGTHFTLALKNARAKPVAPALLKNRPSQAVEVVRAARHIPVEERVF